MKAALALALLVCAAPLFAADAPKPAAPPPGQPASGPDANAVPSKDQQPNPGTESLMPFAVTDFDEAVKAEEDRLESDLKTTLKVLDDQYASQKDLEGRQMKAKFDFLKKMRDQRAAFERSEIDAWKKFAVTLRSVAPAERGAAKIQFDQASMERRRKNDESAVQQNKEFMESQQRERDQFWAQVQKQNNENARLQQEHARGQKAVKQP